MENISSQTCQKRELIGGHEVIFPQELGRFPVVINSLPADMDIALWLYNHKEMVDQYLAKYGALLFRGFPVGGVEGFNKILPAIFSEQIEYKQRTSPRHAVLGNVYTSTDHPNDQVINMHTESSYAVPWPNRICFYAATPPDTGGETPIADVRRVRDLLSPATIEEFERKGVRYVRNILPGVGMTWKEIYQVEDRQALEDVLKQADLQYEWLSEDHLRIIWNRPAFREHPATGASVWFNHAFFYSKHLLDEFIREVIPDEDLPFVSYYGDGSEISEEVINEIRQAYETESILFKWEKDDLLLLDNMLFAHGRMPFKGDRKILVAMGNPVS